MMRDAKYTGLYALALTCMTGLTGMTAAITPEEALQQGKDLGASLNTTVDPAQIDPATTLPGYPGTNVPETQYQALGVGIEDEARAALPASEVGTYVQDSAESRPQFTFDRDTDPLLLRGADVAANAEASVGMNLSGQYSDCQQQTVTTGPAQTSEERCTEWGTTVEQPCTRDLDVAVDVQQCSPGATLASQTITNGLNSTSLSMDLVCNADPAKLTLRYQFTGWCYTNYAAHSDTAVLSVESSARILTPGPHISIYSRCSSYDADGNCTGYADLPLNSVDTTQLIGAEYFRRGCGLLFTGGGCTGSNCNYTFRFIDQYNWDDGYYPDVDRTFTLNFPPPRNVVTTDTWANGCATLETQEQAGLCAVTVPERCTAPNETRVINGESVFRNCWRYETTYTCASGDTVAEPYCQELRDRGCVQINSTCVATLPDGRCSEYEQTYRCTQAPATTQTILDCQGQTFCLGGGCFDTGYAPSGDFGLAASYLGAIDAMAKDLDPTALTIFNGTARSCTKASLGFYNCCKDSGWGTDLGLAQCSESEQILAQQSLAGQCHYVGSYCSNEVLGICTSRGYAYCCFNSKLARIIQEQGRAQLGISFGAAEAPDCRGLTPEEIERIDFARIDFSEFYADAYAAAEAIVKPGTTELQQLIQQRIQEKFP